MGSNPQAELYLQQIIPGASLIRTANTCILAGMPPEVVKCLKEKEIGIPTVWLLPDQYLVGGISRLSVEFPFYYSVFFSGLLQRNGQIKLIGSQKQIHDCMEILRLGLLGLTRKEMEESQTDPTIIEQLLTEIHWLAIKEKDGRVKTVESFFECYFLEEQERILVEGIQIFKRKADEYHFSFQGEEVLLKYEPTEKILPNYFHKLPPNVNLMPSPRFGVHFLGSATGFSNAPSSGLIVQHGSRMILIDPIPYVSALLEIRGLHRNQISAILITHNHDDHAGGLSEFLVADKKVTLITTKEIHYQMMTRLSIFTGQPLETVSQYFHFCPICPGTPYRYYGLEIISHYTIHSIPTIGAEFVYHGVETTKRIRIMGDQNSLENIRKMRSEGILSEERYQQQLDLFNKPADLLIGDVGQGLIHGDPADYEASLAKQIVFMHQDHLPREYLCRYSLAQPGYSFELIRGSFHNDLLIAGKVLQSNFQIHEYDWVDALLGSCNFRTFNPGEVVLRQNESSDSVFLVLQGQLDFYINVEQYPKKVAYAHPGDLFGEMSVITGCERRNASVVARSSVHLAELDGHLFYDFISQNNLKATLLETWEKRSVLQGLKLFEGIALSTISRIAQNAYEVHFLPLQILLDPQQLDQNLYIVKEGEVSLTLEGHPEKTILSRSDYFGYGGSVLKTSKTSSVLSEKKGTLLVLPWSKLQEIAKDVPLLRYRLQNFAF
jgi:CRP-like cAMP-binding protein